ncbi:MAG: HEAT repeat domain-containing protein [Blastocatellia bacterium]
MEIILATILSYLVGLAANLRTDAILARREKRLKKQLGQEDILRKALISTRSLREELRAACAELARNRQHLGVTPQEEPLWHLLSDETFQSDLVEWLRAGGIEEGNAVKERLLQRIEAVVAHTGASPEQIAFLRSSYFDAVDKAVFAHPVLARWRHQLSLDYLREQVTLLRQRAEEAAGVYSPEKQKEALDRYCEKALAVWDIIDLSNLPEGDIHMATQKLLLRQLYMPLRIEVELSKGGEGDDAALAGLEEQREARRHREAGHLFADEPDRPAGTETRAPVGERLGASHRLVVLGDPGGGKTTMLRWMATAYLLRYRGDDAFRHIPDTETLPGQDWIPVLIRCRDLGEADLCRCFIDFLTQHLNKTELLPAEANVMRAVILDRIAKGEALLLVDGLDEITNPKVRMMFCQELERTAARYPAAPIVVTSRIVGYRDMPYRMGSAFEHGVIAELNRDDKDLFARRWVEVTEQHQPAAEKARRAQELLDALHSSDRIERLTGNPMLLTTLALVKRKVGKLPSRRTKLYAEGVSVLLNWNPRVYQTIDEDEAIPQLEYLAYEMCRRGVQRLTEDEVLDLLEAVRREYPNVRAVRRRESQAFLELLEARSSILIKSGGIWQQDRTQEKPVWEFRHLTFQEYLAARALLDGRYPGRDKSKSLAEQVAPLAGAVEEAKRRTRSPIEEVEVPESWREALRLLVADCKDDDVDEVLLAILKPMDGEDPAKTGRPRAVLATLCLADEPNVGEESAKRVLAEFAARVGEQDGGGYVSTSLDQAAMEIGTSIWSSLLKKTLIQKFCQRPSDTRWNAGGLLGLVEASHWFRSGIDSREVFTDLVQRLQSGDREARLSATLTVMESAYEQEAVVIPGLIDTLMQMLSRDEADRFAAAWALLWLNGGFSRNTGKKSFWLPTAPEFTQLVRQLEEAPSEEKDFRRYLFPILSNIGADNGEISASMLVSNLNSSDAEVRRAIVHALGRLGDKQAIKPLTQILKDSDDGIFTTAAAALTALGADYGPMLIEFLDHVSPERRKVTVKYLVKMRDKLEEGILLSSDLDGGDPWIDPETPITEERIAKAARRLKITTQEARARYESLAADFYLRFA